MVIKIDSIAIKRFHYFGSGLWENYVWFKKIGQYVCWRDKYIQEDGTLKWLDLTFPNRYKNLSSANTVFILNLLCVINRVVHLWILIEFFLLL